MIAMKTLSRHFCSALIMTAMIVTGATMASADVLTSVKKSGVIKIAVPQDFPPFGSVGQDMKPIGYDIDMANLIAEKLGVKLELVPVSSTNRIPYLNTGKVDLVVSSLGKNPERAQVIDFSSAYAPYFNGVFGPQDLVVNNAEDLAGKTVSATRGSIEDLELSKIAPNSAVIKRFEDNSATISAYLTGQVDLVATGNVVAASVNEKNPEKMLATKFIIKESPCYVGVAKNEPAIMEAVNSIISDAKKDGTLDAICAKWLHNPLPAGL